KADSGRESLVCVINVSVCVVPTDAGYADNACIYVGEAALGFAVHALWKVDFPAQAIGHRELGRNAPGILAVKEPALLAFRGVQTGADEALKRSYVAQQESCKTVAAYTAVGGISPVDV